MMGANGEHRRLKDEDERNAEGGDSVDDDVDPASECLLYPGDDFKVAWDFAMMLLILYSAVSVPFRIAFKANAEGVLPRLV